MLTQKKLHTLTLESDRLKQETGSRNELLTRIDAETRMVEEERAKAEQINKKYRQQLSDYKVCFLITMRSIHVLSDSVIYNMEEQEVWW